MTRLFRAALVLGCTASAASACADSPPANHAGEPLGDGSSLPARDGGRDGQTSGSGGTVGVATPDAAHGGAPEAGPAGDPDAPVAPLPDARSDGPPPLHDASPEASDAGPGEPTDGGPSTTNDSGPGSVTDAGSSSPPDATPTCPTPPLRAGLRTRARVDVDLSPIVTIGHSREIAVGSTGVFVADSNGLPIIRLDGVSAQLENAVPYVRNAHCSTLALHEASQQLFCATPESDVLTVYDVTNHAAPRTVAAASVPSVVGISDLTVSGDRLFLATLGGGLLSGDIATDGGSTSFVSAGFGVDTVAVVTAGGKIAALDRTAGLAILDEATAAVLATAPLAGPPLDLAFDGARVAVAFGSEGVALYDLGPGGLSTPVTVQPRCVATAAALDGNRLAVACLTGVFLYDLSVDPPRPAGFVEARYGMLDVEFTPWGLGVADWFEFLLLDADTGGEVLVPDLPAGLYVNPTESPRFSLRNPGSTPMPLTWHLVDGHVPLRDADIDLLPGGEQEIVIAASELPAVPADSSGIYVTVTRRDPGCTEPPEPPPRVALVRRDPATDPATGAAAIGDPFPVLTSDSPATTPAQLPVTGSSSFVLFLAPDCFLQWPQLEDLAWLQQTAQLPGSASPLVFLLNDPNQPDVDPTLMPRFGSGSLLTVPFGHYLTSLPGYASGGFPADVFERTFALRMIPGSDFPNDRIVDAGGLVTATLRKYRGKWPL